MGCERVWFAWLLGRGKGAIAQERVLSIRMEQSGNARQLCGRGVRGVSAGTDC